MSEILGWLHRQTNEDELLDAFAERLCCIPGLNNGIVVVSDQPTPLMMPHGKLCVTVSAGPGRFDERMQAGGSFDNLVMSGSVVVAIFIQSVVDKVGRAEVLERNISKWTRLVLAYILKERPEKERCQAWEPRKSGRALLASQITVSDVSSLKDIPGTVAWVGRELSFNVEYKWDLKITNE